MTLRLFSAAALVALPLILTQQSTEGAVKTFDLDFEFSHAVPPQGTAPWLTATFDDSFGGANTVRLTMSAAGLVGTEFVDDWLFNFDPALDPTLLTFAVVNNGASVPNHILTGVDAYKADGDGFFDIMFDFPPPPGHFADEFTTGEAVVYNITYTSPITELSFDLGSAPGGGNGTFKSAAHVQGIDQTKIQETDEFGNLLFDEGHQPIYASSGWIGPGGSVVPEPASVMVWSMLGAIALAISYRRSRTR